MPFVRIGSHRLDAGIPVTMDDEGSARLATRHLIDHGHRRIGFIAGPAEYELSGWRVDGWRAAMAEAGLPVEGLLEPGDFSLASGEAAARRLLARADRPTAIIASNDQMALGTLDVARSLGLAVPRDLSLISFDNSPVVQFAQPPLTAIDQSIAATAAMAVELIIARRKGEPAPADITVIPSTLISRGSVARPG
jgi:LacI family transcriptional regulator